MSLIYPFSHHNDQFMLVLYFTFVCTHYHVKFVNYYYEKSYMVVETGE